MAGEKTSEKSDKASRDRLIKAAIKLFARKGFNGVSVKEIAEEAEVNVALVSYYFGGKEGLYKACFEDFVERRLEFIDKKILRPASREEFRYRLQYFLETLLEEDLDNPDCICIVHREMASDDPVVREIFQKTVIRLFGPLSEFFESAKKGGYLRSDVSSKDMSGLLMGAYSQRVRVDRLAKDVFGESLRDPKVRARFISNLVEMFLNGFAVRTSEDKK